MDINKTIKFEPKPICNTILDLLLFNDIAMINGKAIIRRNEEHIKIECDIDDCIFKKESPSNVINISDIPNYCECNLMNLPKKNMKKDNKDFQSKDKDQTNDLGGNSNKRNNNFGEGTGRKDRKENFSSKNTKNNDKNRKDRAMLWYMDENKELRVLRVKLGLSDDQNTEIVEIPEDKLNVNIISGIANGTKSNKNKTTNQSFRQGSMRMF